MQTAKHRLLKGAVLCSTISACATKRRVMNPKPADTNQTPESLAVPSNSQPLSSEAESTAETIEAGFVTDSSPDEPTARQPTPNPLMAIADVVQLLVQELQAELNLSSASGRTVIGRIAAEVERVCSKSDRIQTSGEVRSWQLALARHRLQKCMTYYRLGSRQGRVELHSNLSALVYRYVAPSQAKLNFQARYSLIEDFLQTFYAEALKTFRRENQLEETYTPRTKLELAEYMAFTEHYAKRRINLPGFGSQRLIVLRAQGFSRRQPTDTTLDMEMAVESGRGEEAEAYNRSPVVHQVREQMVANATDSSDAVLRENVISELLRYLESQGQNDCIDYLTLRLQDLSAQEIDEILDLSPRQRDYLQQRFKYHVEKFARSQNWKLVHQWLGADLDQNLGMAPQTWQAFINQLSEEQQQIVALKRSHSSDQDIATQLRLTLKQVQKRWSKILELAWEFRNQRSDAG